MMTPEYRYLEIRSSGIDERVIHGVALAYGDVAHIGNISERFDVGAFGADVSSQDIILNFQHERSRPLARTRGGGLVLADNAEALHISAKLPLTQDCDEALALVDAKVLRGFSIEFIPIRTKKTDSTRVVQAARLMDIGLVDRPAYELSEAAVRLAVNAEGLVRERITVWL